MYPREPGRLLCCVVTIAPSSAHALTLAAEIRPSKVRRFGHLSFAPNSNIRRKICYFMCSSNQTSVPSEQIAINRKGNTSAHLRHLSGGRSGTSPINTGDYRAIVNERSKPWPCLAPWAAGCGKSAIFIARGSRDPPRKPTHRLKLPREPRLDSATCPAKADFVSNRSQGFNGQRDFSADHWRNGGATAASERRESWPGCRLRDSASVLYKQHNIATIMVYAYP